MSEQENTKLVQRVYGNFKGGDIKSLLDSLSDDVSWQLPEIENVPFSGKRQGREKVAQFFTSVAESQEVLQFEPQEFIAEGNKVVALGHYSWRVKSTGRVFTGNWAHVFTVQEGRIVAFHEYTDTAAAAGAYQRAAHA